MGWLSRRRSPVPYSSHRMRTFRLALYFVLGLFLGGYGVLSHAYPVPIAPAAGAGVAANASGWGTASNFVGTFSGASFNGNFTGQVAGRAVTMPASMRMAANAGQFAANAARFNPAGLLSAIVAGWLLEKGLEYINGQWTKKQPDDAPITGKYWWHGFSSGSCHSSANKCSYGQLLAEIVPIENAAFRSDDFSITGIGNACGTGCVQLNYTVYGWSKGSIGVFYGGVADPLRYPAADSDFAIPGLAPDAVANELAKKGVSIPLEDPDVQPVDIPLSDPYTDPATGRKYQDRAKVSPSEDAKSAEATPYKQEVSPDGTPAKNEDGTDKAPEEQTDFCKQNPEALACAKLGEPEDVDPVEERNKDVAAITPASGFGPSSASCPADITKTLKSGVTIVQSWQPVCQYASGIRPVVVGVAWLIAAMIFIGVTRKNSA